MGHQRITYNLGNEIAEHRKAEREPTINTFQKIFNNSPGVIYQFKLRPDGSFCFPFANPAFKEFFNIDPEEVREDASKVFNLIHPDDLEGTFISIKQSAKNMSHWQHEARIAYKDNVMRWILCNAMPHQEQDGSIIWMGFITDITEQKQLEEELNELNIILEQRVMEEINNHMKQEQLLIQQSKMAQMGEMIGLIAHQWRQPLGILSIIISDFEDIYAIGKMDDKYVKDSVEKSLQQILFMSNTIDDFKNFLKPSKEKIKFDVKSNIEQLFSMFKKIFISNNIDVSIITDEGAELFTEGYPNEFKQVILNILNNSKDAIVSRKQLNTEIKGQIEINLKNSKDKYKIVVSISDNAGGIPEAIIEKIFEPYYTTKESQGGTGLGLYMSKTIIETNMGGMLTVRNVAGGAEFLITLDVYKSGIQDGAT